MRLLQTFTFLTAAFLYINSSLFCASVTEEREVSGFSRLEISYSGDVTIIQGDREGVVLSGSPKSIKQIKTEVKGETLHIRKKRSFLFSPYDPEITVYISTIKAIQLSGSGKLMADTLQSEELGIDITGSGDVGIKNITANYIGMKITGSGLIKILDIKVTTMDTSISGSGDLIVSGRGEKGRLKITGSGKIDAAEMIVQNCDIKISGSGDAHIYVEQMIRVKITGSGDVKYGGKPSIDIIGITGSGSIQPL